MKNIKKYFLLVAALAIALPFVAIAGYDTDMSDMSQATIMTPADVLTTDYVKVFRTATYAAALVPVSSLGSSFEDTTATNILTSTECGKTLTLNSATEFVTTLPAPVAGCKFSFFVKAAPSGASYTIVTNASANVIVGHVLTNDVNSATDADFEASGGDTISLVDAKSVVGDSVSVVSDGTSWFVTIETSVFDGATITTAS